MYTASYIILFYPNTIKSQNVRLFINNYSKFIVRFSFIKYLYLLLVKKLLAYSIMITVNIN